MADSELIWMRHGEHGGTAQFPAASAAVWAVKGWAPCEAPLEADPALVEYVPLPVVAAEPEPEADAAPEPEPAKPAKATTKKES